MDGTKSAQLLLVIHSSSCGKSAAVGDNIEHDRFVERKKEKNWKKIGFIFTMLFT
tara:strand:+ start:349 stop:513 length:165 start_codon:yes stop_codon:yes gene_type:complete